MSWGLVAKLALACALMVPNIVLTRWSIETVLQGGAAVDWIQYVEAGRRIGQPDLFGSTDTYGWHYSPVLAYVFAVLGVIGTTAWRLLHFAAAVALPGWTLVAVTLISWPFWYDVETGNVLIFVLLAAAWALRGNAVAIFCFLALTLLIPRPLMLPLAAWLLWQHPEWRGRFAIMFAVHALAVVATGAGPAWLAELMSASGDQLNPSNIGPSRFVGLIWLVVGIPLAAFLTWKGRVGLASLAISPYLHPYYVLMGLLELVPHRFRKASSVEYM